MPIIESQLNGRIATLLGNLDRRWMARGENVGVFAGTNEIPDILITQAGAPPLVIENEYQPAATVAADALGRLGASLNSAAVNASGTVSAVIALRSPTELRACDTLDEVDDLLRGGVRLEYALFAGTDVMPGSGFRRPALSAAACGIWRLLWNRRQFRLPRSSRRSPTCSAAWRMPPPY